jgi:hypothetical protein
MTVSDAPLSRHRVTPDEAWVEKERLHDLFVLAPATVENEER